MRIVRCAPKPSLRAASCCSVEVVNGGDGLRLRCFFSTFVTTSVPPAACSSVLRAAFGPAGIDDRELLDLAARKLGQLGGERLRVFLDLRIDRSSTRAA